MNTQDRAEALRCTRCKEVQETYSEIVYSQGDKVCLDCKKETQADDDRAFDSDMNRKIIRGFQ